MNSSKQTIRAYLIFFLILAAIIGFALFSIAWITTFHVHKNLSYNEKTQYANYALMPDIANYIERYGVRGFMDADCQIETVTFNSINNLTSAMPFLECYKDSPVSSGKDIKGKKAKVYELDTVRLFNSRSSVLPLSFDLVEKGSEKEYWTLEYSIFEYSDGTCRFVIFICPG